MWWRAASGRVRSAARAAAGEDAILQVTLRRYVEGGRPGAWRVLNDATRLKTLEAQFVQSQKMQAIGQLAGELRMISTTC
jgi:hypothetical protein